MTMHNAYYLRPMRMDDIPQVFEIEMAVQVSPWSEAVFRDCLTVEYDAWVAISDENINGFILAYRKVQECHILNVAVRPETQRHGVGRLLMQRVINDARNSGVDIVFLEVRPSNTAAIRLYQQLGFNEVGLRKNYYPAAEGREDALVYALQLV